MRVFNLEKEAFLASGIEKKEEIAFYILKLDHLLQKFIAKTPLPPDLISRAKALFQWLWIEKPARYKPHGSFKLNDVIDAQLSEDSQTVGNCLGLTLLYHCLLKKIGIHPEALYLENAFGIGPHILTLLKIKECSVHVENILPDGFDYKGHLGDSTRTKWGDKELVADIYHSLGNECFEKGEFIEALKNYETAIKLNPQYEKAHLNKIILLDRIGDKKSKVV